MRRTPEELLAIDAAYSQLLHLVNRGGSNIEEGKLTENQLSLELQSLLPEMLNPSISPYDVMRAKHRLKAAQKRQRRVGIEFI